MRPIDLWTNVYTSCIMGDGNNGSSQTFEINVTNPARARCLLAELQELYLMEIGI